jgi:hypothetical protein
MSFQPRVVGRRLTVAVSTRTNIALGAGRREAETGIYKRRWTMAIVNSEYADQRGRGVAALSTPWPKPRPSMRWKWTANYPRAT